MDQSEPNAHVDDEDNASCLGHMGLPELFQNMHRWHEEHYHYHSDLFVASPVNVGGQIDYATISIISSILYVFPLRDHIF